MTTSNRRPAGMKLTAVEVEQEMNAGEAILHALLIAVTFGMWYPFYRARRRQIRRTSKFYSA